MPADEFTAVAEAGHAAVLSGTHAQEDAPERTGRWGPSTVFRPSGELSSALAVLAAEAGEITGSDHWPSGGVDRAHVTVRALEPYIAALPEDRATRYLTAARRATDALGPVGFRFQGVTLSVGSVMVKATPADGRANLLRQRLGHHLGDDGWLEDRVFPNGRDPIWYCSILHFAGPIASPERLIEWAVARCNAPVGESLFTEVDLCTWRFDGEAMTPKIVGSASTT